jgi:hypothetical protein
MERLPWRQLIAAVLGGGAGYAYYVTLGCDTG